MATITLRARADGLIVQLTRDGAALIPPEPDAPTQTLSFDDETNAQTAADLIADPLRFRLLAGTLRKDGIAVVIAADGESLQVRALAASAISDLTTYIGLANPTAAQRLAFERLVARVLRYFIRREFGL